MKQIQLKVGAEPDGIFGPMTARAIRNFYWLSSEEAAHLLGQSAHESGGFKKFEERFSYSAERLLDVFGKYFSTMELARHYEYKPSKIASKVYAGRMGNGDEESGDGWKHRGFGAIQLTGKDNHKAFSLWVKDPEVFCEPKLIAEKYAIESAIFYFERNGIFRYCTEVSDPVILTVSRAVNVGNPNSMLIPHGMPSRREWTYKIYRWLK